MKHLSHKVIIAAVFLLPVVIFVLAFSNGRYEAIDLPSVETAEADIRPTEAEDETESSSAAVKETETAAPEKKTMAASETEKKAPEFRNVDETVYITGSSVNFRKGSSVESEVIDTLPIGTELKRTGIGDIWSRVICKGQEGYVGNKYLSKENPKN